jgi:hypothetical protein
MTGGLFGAAAKQASARSLPAREKKLYGRLRRRGGDLAPSNCLSQSYWAILLKAQIIGEA